MEDTLIIQRNRFQNRVSGWDREVTRTLRRRKGHRSSVADVVTVRSARTNITDRKTENLLDYLDPKLYQMSAEHRGCLHGGRCLACIPACHGRPGVSDLIKLESDRLTRKHSSLDVIGLLQATRYSQRTGS